MFPLGDSVILYDDNWESILAAAEAAGRHAARQLAQQCGEEELSRNGRIEVFVGPPGSPLASWLACSREDVTTCEGRAVINIELNEKDLSPAASTENKTESLLAKHAYAAAFETVLAEEAGAVTDRRIIPDLIPPADVPVPRPGTGSIDQNYSRR